MAKKKAGKSRSIKRTVGAAVSNTLSRMLRSRKRGVQRRNKRKRIARKLAKRGAIIFSPGKGLIPNETYVNVSYFDSQTVPSGTFSTSLYRYNCNDYHDPNLSGIGTEGFGHDQMKVFYDRYEVVGAKIMVEFIPNDAQQIDATATVASQRVNDCFVGVYIENPGESFPTQLSTAMANGMGKWKPIAHYSGPFEARPQRQVITAKWSIRKARAENTEHDDSEWQAAFEASPSLRNAFRVMAGRMTGANTNAYHINVKLDYIVRCFQKKNTIAYTV